MSAFNHKGHPSVSTIAFYLPQFHPIPENDRWWGKGFTEWTNVAKARPLFPGHYQPHIPADLGFYDLRLPEARQAQADLAKEYGIHGFCYYHYWFEGKRLLERPFTEVWKSGTPDHPFCLCWANESWTRAWTEDGQVVLMQQTYSERDDLEHIRYLSEIFKDRRYIRYQNKPLFLIYRASNLPNPLRTTNLWREEAHKLGVGEIYLCRVESGPQEHNDPRPLGFDAAVEFQPDWRFLKKPKRGLFWRLVAKFGLPIPVRQKLKIYKYEYLIEMALKKEPVDYKRFPCVTPRWDNTPRRLGLVLTESAPELYEYWLRTVIKHLRQDSEGESFVFINAWNEWAEGNHLEPDLQYGRVFLEATKTAQKQSTTNSV